MNVFFHNRLLNKKAILILTHLFVLVAWAILPSSSINAQPVVIGPSPEGQSVRCEGDSISWAISAFSAAMGDLQFNWFYKASEVSTAIPFTSGTVENTDSTSRLRLLNLATNKTGFYFCRVTDGDDEQTDSDEVELIVAEEPTSTITSTGDLNCSIDTVVLNGSSSTQGVSYNWSFPDGDTSTAPIVLVTDPGIYTLHVENTCGTDMEMVEVKANFDSPLPIMISSNPNDAEITCANAQVLLTAEGNSLGSNSFWRRPDQTTDTGTATTAATEGLYTFVGIHSASECIDSASINVTEDRSDFPMANTSISDILSCVVSSTTLSASALSNVNSIQWINPSGITVGSDSTLIATEPGTFQLVLTNGSCSHTLEVEVEEDITPPDVSIAPLDPVLCEGGDVEITASGGDVYEWSPNGESSESITVSQPAVYSVEATNTTNGCTASTSIEVMQRPTPEVFLSNTAITVTEGQSEDILVDVTPMEAIATWSVFNEQNANTGGVIDGEGDILLDYFLNSSRGTGSVSISVVPDNEGCLGDEIIVSVNILPILPDGIFIPELITPNNDGANDLWQIETDDGVELTAITIFNRAGGKVADLPPTEQWNANNCPDGVYFYVIEYTSNGEKKASKGALTVLRSTN